MKLFSADAVIFFPSRKTFKLDFIALPGFQCCVWHTSKWFWNSVAKICPIWIENWLRLHHLLGIFLHCGFQDILRTDQLLGRQLVILILICLLMKSQLWRLVGLPNYLKHISDEAICYFCKKNSDPNF